ncbi:hypothetical protein PMAC_001528 [Pneumocystis sp. 'macacae']|nr:hypothetical protein PMAC_001528 [Pneumocystis sp. 'macacae']
MLSNSLKLIKVFIQQGFMAYEKVNHYKKFYRVNLIKNTNYYEIIKYSTLYIKSICTLQHYIDSNNINSQSEKCKKSIELVKKNNNRYTKKIIQISWNITEHDLKHRLKIAMKSLEKGYDIDIVIGSKRYKKFELCKREELFKRLRETFLEKGIERKSAIGTFNDSFTLYFKPKKIL